MAMAVARRVCGAALFALHVDKVGADRYVPGIEKKSEAYRILWFFDSEVVLDQYLI